MQPDYIVVGAGSAGCAVACRLVEGGATVALLEAGPKDTSWRIHVPAALRPLLKDPKVNWNYQAEPVASTAGRPIALPRGMVLGGSSSINGMLYVRGNAADFDGWAQRGCIGWSYDDVLPLFRKSETYKQGGDAGYRGDSGPLQVEDYRTILPLTHKFVEAAQQAGFPLTPDYNGGQQEGVGYSQMTRRGRLRGSTAQTYLRAVRDNPKLQIITGAKAGPLLFEGRKCVGITYRQDGQDKELRPGREIVLCGGAYNSPQLLQISGIGPAAHLQSIGVEVRHDLPGVGSNLADHFGARLKHRVRGITMNQLSRFPHVVPEIAKFFLFGNGALTFGVTSAIVFCRSREGLASPDLQLSFTPATPVDMGQGDLEKEPGIQVTAIPVRAESRGTVMARSGNPDDAPAISPNYLGDENDVNVLVSGVEITRRILAQPAMAAVSLGEYMPGPEVTSRDEIMQFTRETGGTIHHPVGTCKMGDDPAAVVDPRLKVHGFEGLRVADASIMPTLTTGNTNAPTIMIGEKCAAMILEDQAAG
ncbi:MAG: GMC family oxidoreductase N-terminal domain-containing protein [Rhodospirillaceae bacterium]|nr:GMC family oxidoreductase N-terminal domain-containing protein [Rhodospirillaceae bacterium]MDD9917816.1 GMC family oxidoreductase N-terminal domain-containing protein [Rhodospirillaceae bacterium]MDD9928727.1 GMC family oxidoreductase N-terminal domain-containing protein [Rhodospirillaceae bacterium]